MSEKKEYVKLWLSYEIYFQPYTPEEVGRLVLAMLHYKDTGEEPVFQGNERFIWPAIQRDINEARDAQEAAAERARENGKKGGRPPKASQESDDGENPAGFSETQETTRTKDKGQCQGQFYGQGQGHTGVGRHGAAPGRRSAAERKKHQESPEENQRYQEQMMRYLQQLKREMAEQEAKEAAEEAKKAETNR